jgi:ribosomal protein L32
LTECKHRYLLTNLHSNAADVGFVAFETCYIHRACLRSWMPADVPYFHKSGRNTTCEKHDMHTLGNELGDRRGVWDVPVPTTSHCQSTVEPHRRNTICLRREQGRYLIIRCAPNHGRQGPRGSGFGVELLNLTCPSVAIVCKRAEAHESSTSSPSASLSPTGLNLS